MLHLAQKFHFNTKAQSESGVIDISLEF
jgi:hypothetical protein